jgi:regulatory protein
VQATALDVAARALARRELSAAELRARLAKAGFGEDEAAQTIEELREAGYQSDERAGRERARVLSERGLGDVGIAFDLRRRGIASETIDDIVATLVPEAERAHRFVARIGIGKRLADTLRRKGYRDETIAAVAGADVADGR